MVEDETPRLAFKRPSRRFGHQNHSPCLSSFQPIIPALFIGGFGTPWAPKKVVVRREGRWSRPSEGYKAMQKIALCIETCVKHGVGG